MADLEKGTHQKNVIGIADMLLLNGIRQAVHKIQ